MRPPSTRPTSRLARWVLLALTACTDTCSPGLQPADAVPFQSCSAGDTCISEVLSCTDCTQTVAINQNQQQAFESLRGCWPVPPPGPGDSDSNGVSCPTTVNEPGCPSAICGVASGICALTPGCGTSATTGFAGAAGGFGATGTVAGNSSAGFTAAGTTGGSLPICAFCTNNSECASGLCNPGDFCDSLSFCASNPSACAPFQCDTQSGDCDCSEANSTTSGTTFATSTSIGANSGTGTTGGATTGGETTSGSTGGHGVEPDGGEHG